MPSHFTSVGIPSVVDMSSVVTHAVENGRHVIAPGGATEVQWRDPSGLALTVTMEDGAPACLKPTVITRSAVRIVPGQIVARADCVYCSVVLADVVDADGELFTRLAFELAEHATTAPLLALDVAVDVSLLAIAHDVVVYADEAAYAAAPAEAEGLRWAAKSWLPTGMFFADGPGARPRAAASFHAVVASAERRTSTAFGGSFWFLGVDSVMPIDVAVDEELLAGREPRTGNVVAVDDAWIVGRLAEVAPSAGKRPWWSARRRR